MSKSEQPPIYVYRRGDTLVGEMEADREWIRQQPASDRIKVTLHTGRNPSRLRWYFAYLSKVIKATECAPNSETLHSLIKLETGYSKPVKLKGYTVLVPASIAFDAMSEADFNTFCEGAVRFIAETYGITPEMVFSDDRTGTAKGAAA